MSSPTFYVQPSFSPNIQTTFGGFGSNQYGQVAHGFMIWDSVTAVPGYSQLAIVSFQFNPSTLSVSYASQTSNQAVTDFIYSTQVASATPLAAMQQSLSFSLLYDRTYELWGSYNVDGTSKAGGSAASSTNVNDPAQVGVGADILAMQQFTGMLDTTDGGIGNATATPGGATGTVLKPQFPLFFIPAWVYFGQSVASLYYYGFVSDWSVQVTQWTQYMVPMRCVMNVDFTLLPTPPISGTAAGTGEGSAPWSTSPLPNTGAGAAAAATPGTTTGTAGGVRGG